MDTEASISYFKRFKSIEIIDNGRPGICDVCLNSKKNSVKYGPFLKKGYVKCHYYCLLTGSNFHQSGVDISGICGFLISDILKAIPQNRINLCYICGKKSAAIQCNWPGCTRRFHYICGYNGECLTKFAGNFESFCHEHHGIKHDIPQPEIQVCYVCFEEMGAYKATSWIVPECCVVDKFGYIQTFHRKCLAKFAWSAGYYFRCPNCYEGSFRDEVKAKGVFVPDRDALWELEPGAFKDLHKNRCTIIPCVEKYKELIACKACGGQLAHQKCVDVDPEQYFCSRCMDATFIQLF